MGTAVFLTREQPSIDSVRFSGRQRSRERRGSALVITASVTLRISSSASSRSLMSSCKHRSERTTGKKA